MRSNFGAPVLESNFCNYEFRLFVFLKSIFLESVFIDTPFVNCTYGFGVYLILSCFKTIRLVTTMDIGRP